MTQNSEITPEEGFNNSLFYFLFAIDVAAADKNTQLRIMGYPPGFASWEIQHDIIDVFPYLIKFTMDHPYLEKYLSACDINAIKKIIGPLQDLPKAALAGHASDLDHPAWEKIRVVASDLVLELREVKRKNHDFFQNCQNYSQPVS